MLEINPDLFCLITSSYHFRPRVRSRPKQIRYYLIFQINKFTNPTDIFFPISVTSPVDTAYEYHAENIYILGICNRLHIFILKEN